MSDNLGTFAQLAVPRPAAGVPRGWGPAANPLTGDTPDLGGAVAQTAGNAGDWIAAQRQKSADMGLLNPETGWPTQAGWQNAADQFAQGYMAGPIKGYHGSGAVFPKFSWDKINTGEGAQAYGYGHYAAGVEPTANYYRDKAVGHGSYDLDFGDGTPPINTNRMNLYRHARDAVDGATVPSFMKQSLARTYVDHITDRMPWSTEAVLENAFGENLPKSGPDLDKAQAYAQHGIEHADAALGKWKLTRPGAMYELELQAEPHELLDWDKPLIEQPDTVKQFFRYPSTITDQHIQDARAAGRQGEAEFLHQQRMSMDSRASLPGSRLYERVKGDIAQENFGQGLHMNDRQLSEAASNRLRESGVPGIQFVDQNTRGKMLQWADRRISATSQLHDLQRKLAQAQFTLGDPVYDPARWGASEFPSSMADMRDYHQRVVQETQQKLDTHRAYHEAVMAEPEPPGISRNYVAFSDEMMKILRRYGFVPPAVGAAASQSGNNSQ